ncbi:hypothetical protein, partial [Kitasatospora herbaricolor]|uniref:hypothetical protein n=1 Tax=Kitasatospora herbaricolor TaxID=68217 RepID=UPI0036D7FE73
GSVALAHQRILRYKRNGAFENIVGDVNNLKLNPTPITIPREVYGTKGRDSQQITGYNFAPTFDVEAVRDGTGAIAQAWLVDMLNRAYSEGADNLGEFQIFDALDENLPAFQGSFSIAVAELNAGFKDKGGYAFTLTNDGVVDRITSPIAGSGKPVIESIPTANGKTVGDQLVIRGYNLGDVTAGTIDGAAITKFTPVDDQTLVILIPATVAGAAPIILTNPAGASTAFNYTAA